MVRRVLGSLILAATALALLLGVSSLRADSKDLTKPPREEEKFDSKSSLEDLRIKQERMQRLFDDFKSALLRLAQAWPSVPDRKNGKRPRS